MVGGWWVADNDDGRDVRGSERSVCVCVCVVGGSQYLIPALSQDPPLAPRKSAKAQTVQGTSSFFKVDWKQSVKGKDLSVGLWKWLQTYIIPSLLSTSLCPSFCV